MQTVNPENETGDGYIAPLTEGFSVRDEATANWLVRRIVELRAYRSKVMAWAAGEIRRSERDERFFWERYGPQLERWAANVIEESHGRRKSIRLPAGVIGFRRDPPRLLVTDEKSLREWCRKSLPEALKLSLSVTGLEARALEDWRRENCPSARGSEEILKSILASHIATTGEVPDGAEIGGGEPKLFVK